MARILSTEVVAISDGNSLNNDRVSSGSPEERLSDGLDQAGAVMRVGGTVRRPGSPAAAQVRLFFAHLEQVGFDGAPRFHGFDDRNREILDYLARSLCLVIRTGRPVKACWSASPPTRPPRCRRRLPRARRHHVATSQNSAGSSRWLRLSHRPVPGKHRCPARKSRCDHRLRSRNAGRSAFRYRYCGPPLDPPYGTILCRVCAKQRLRDGQRGEAKLRSQPTAHLSDGRVRLRDPAGA